MPPVVVTGAQFTHFSYNPNVAANALVLAVLFVQLIAHIAQGVYYRTWGFMGTMLAGLGLEIAGYTSRILMHNNPSSRTAFLLNNITLILGPACIAGSIYLCMGNIVKTYGERLSVLKPRMLFIIFVCCDLLNLILQGIGGGVCSTEQSPYGIQAGINIVIAGLATQVTSLLLFMACCAHFSWRVYRFPERKVKECQGVRESARFHQFLIGLGLATVCIFTRSVFRIVELHQGFMGPLANSEVHFMILECGMMLMATTALTVAHPGRCFQDCWSRSAPHTVLHVRQSSSSQEIRLWQSMDFDIVESLAEYPKLVLKVASAQVSEC